MTDRIEKTVLVRAPIERVWRALSDHREFGSWFKVALDGPFVAGERSTGKMTYPGYEGYPWLAWVTAVEAPHRLAFDMRRVLRTRYRTDDFQLSYFVIDKFEDLLRLAEREELPALYAELDRLGDIDPALAEEHERLAA